MTDAERDAKLREAAHKLIEQIWAIENGACVRDAIQQADFDRYVELATEAILAERERVRLEEARWWKEWAVKYSMGVSVEGRQAAYDRALTDRS